MSEVDDWHRGAIVAFERGSFEAAVALLERAVAIDPARADIQADLAVIAHNIGDRAKAETHFLRALTLTPDAPRLNFNFANLLRDLARHEEAAERYRTAIAGEPGFAPAHNNLGNVLKELKRWDEAATAYRAAIVADPDFAPAHRNLADIDEMKGRTEKAIAGFMRAASLRDDPGARIRAALAMPIIPGSVGEIDEIRARIEANLNDLIDAKLRLDDPLRQVGATPFHLAYHGRKDRPLMEALAKIYRAACPSLSYTAPHVDGWLGGLEGGPIRIGFVSAFLRDHTIARLNENLIAKLPRDKFEVRVFDRLPRDLAAARAILAQAELDIIYYTDIGMEPLTYFLGFARLAPVQCVAWGHPVTTGIDTIDYFISSRLIEPNGAVEAYSERLIQLDALPASVAAPEYGRAEADGPVFLCPQSLFKIHPEFDAMIGAILSQCPAAELAILDGQHPEWRAALDARWRRTIPHVIDRIRFVPRRDRAGFMSLLASARVILDTPHFSGGLSSLEALTAETPVVTLAGDYMRSRVTLGQYRRMGMGDVAATDAETYVATAVRLARDDAYLSETRDRIASSSLKLIDDPAPITEHALFFEKAVYGTV
jgi:predicted O-linked N-acetylglucosamine transferase (SPINDLY family)